MYKESVIRLGYPAQNLTIPASTNRTLRLANLGDAEKVRTLVWENLLGLETILRWNAEHGVKLFRIGQSLIPFASHPSFPYEWKAEHGDDLREIGELARTLGIRLSTHPGQFIQPGSLRPGVSERSLAELRYVARMFDLIGSSDSVIVLHMGGAYEDRAASTVRFVETMRSETGILRYLALENDERVWPLVDIVHTARSLGVPAIADAFHHELNPGGLTLREALDLSLPTWEVRSAPEGPPLEPRPRQASRGARLLGRSRRLVRVARRPRRSGGRHHGRGERQRAGAHASKCRDRVTSPVGELPKERLGG